LTSLLLLLLFIYLSLCRLATEYAHAMPDKQSR
jgi:hypothetical protein